MALNCLKVRSHACHPVVDAFQHNSGKAEDLNRLFPSESTKTLSYQMRAMDCSS